METWEKNQNQLNLLDDVKLQLSSKIISESNLPKKQDLENEIKNIDRKINEIKNNGGGYLLVD